MNHAGVAAKLLPFQEPYNEFYGRKVRVFRRTGVPVAGELLSPVSGCLPPAHKLYLKLTSGKIWRIPMANVRKIEVLS